MEDNIRDQQNKPNENTQPGQCSNVSNDQNSENQQQDAKMDNNQPTTLRSGIDDKDSGTAGDETDTVILESGLGIDE